MLAGVVYDAHMKGLLACGVFLALLLCAGPIAAQEYTAPAVLTNIQHIRMLERQKSLPSNSLARVRGTVTLALRDVPSLLIQDGTNGIHVRYRGAITNYDAGTVVDVEGPIVPDSYAASIGSAKVTAVSCGDLPRPVPVQPTLFTRGHYFGQFVSVRGVIRDMRLTRGRFHLMVTVPSGQILAQVPVDNDFSLPRDWMESEVELRGPCWTDPRGVIYGFQIYPPEVGFVRQRTSGKTNAFDFPFVSLKTIADERRESLPRIRTRGVVTHISRFQEFMIYEDGVAAGGRIFRPLQLPQRALESIAHDIPHPKVGDYVEISASVSHLNRSILLLDAMVRVLGQTNMPQARSTDLAALMAGKYWNELVRVKARLIDVDRTMSHPFYVERYLFQTDDGVFAGVVHVPEPTEYRLKKDDYVEVTGINRPQLGAWDQIHSINLSMRDLNDIRPVSAPGFWERREARRTATIVGIVVLLAGAWIAWQTRQMRRLRASEGRFRALIDNSFDVTIVLDAQGTAKYMSPSGRQLFGKVGKNGEPLSMSSLVHPDDLPRLMAAQQAVLKEPGASQTVSDYRILTRDGSERYAEAIGTNCLHVPGVHGVVVNIRDITGRKKAENEAASREREEHRLRLALTAEKELNLLKTSFISMVSHEFRTPLEVILSSSNILDRYLERLPAEKRKTQLRAIRKSVHRMNDLVEDVLLIGKFDAGRMACSPISTDLEKLCRRLVAEVESAAQREGAIRIHCEDLDSEAAVDEGLLNHVLTNLLGNAIKYSRDGTVVEFTVTRRGPDAEFIIRDQGCGIPEADRARLFTAFYRGSNVGQTPGSGLGLVIVKRCVDLHEGVIRCESEVGKGTTFIVTLPLFDGTRRFYRKPVTQPQISNANDSRH